MARMRSPKVVRARIKQLREGGQITTRLLVGESSGTGKPWFGVRVWDRDVIRYPSLADAEVAFEAMTAGQVELPPAKRR